MPVCWSLKNAAGNRAAAEVRLTTPQTSPMLRRRKRLLCMLLLLLLLPQLGDREKDKPTPGVSLRLSLPFELSRVVVVGVGKIYGSFSRPISSTPQAPPVA